MRTFERLIQVCNTVFEGELDVSNATPESRLREDIGMNSIGLLYMAMALEEEFSIKFASEDFTQIATIADVVSTIERKVG